jgi:putative nucleotidyltransferase with HDIG domain
MLWGWLRRWRMEKRLADTVALLGPDTAGVREPGDELEPEARVKALKKLVAELEAREPHTHGHSRRVARYSTMIAKKLGLPAAEVAKIRLAANLHDVGKLVVPLAILNKPDKLTDEEFAEIQRHAPVGADMVSRIGDDDLTQIVAYHHERLDGSGYPAHLNGAEIPLGARIVAVADTFDALTSARPYRSAQEHREAFRILDEEAGERLDPRAVRAFRGCYSGIRGIAAWSIVSGVPQRLLYPLGGQAPVAGGTLPAKALAALATATTAASIGIGSSLSAAGGGDPAAGRALATAVRSVGDSGPEARGSERPAAPGPQGQEPAQVDSGGGGQGPGDTPGGGDPQPNPPGPANPPGPDPPAIPDDPVSDVQKVVEGQLERLGEQIREQPVPASRPSVSLGVLD